MRTTALRSGASTNAPARRTAEAVCAGSLRTTRSGRSARTTRTAASHGRDRPTMKNEKRSSSEAVAQQESNRSFPLYFATWYKKSPYFRRTVEAGCTSWDLYNHMLIPTMYEDDVEEYWHLLNHVTLWDVAVERQVEITGSDAARFTQLLTPRDLGSTRVGQCKYVTICAPDGGI